MIAAGVRRFACGLGAAKSLRAQADGGVLVTDGPYLETKEHIGGFWILECADMDEAVAWAPQRSVRHAGAGRGAGDLFQSGQRLARAHAAVQEETVALPPMFDPAKPPQRATLDATLGAAAPLWHSAIRRAVSRAPQLAEAWHFAGPRIGWSLRLVDGDRIVVYLTPGTELFCVGLVLGAKAVEAAREAGLSTAAADILEAAPKYAEGHGVRFVVASSEDLAPFDELLSIKLAGSPKAKPRGRRGR